MIIASAQIGTLRGALDGASIFLNSGTSLNGTSLKSNFQSVLEQHHVSPESASETDDAQGAIYRSQKDSGPTTIPSVPQPVTPAGESPRQILPFTTSITLRHDATSSPDDAATHDETPSADALPAAIATTSPASAILHGTRALHRPRGLADAKTNSALTVTQTKSDDSGLAQTAAPLAQTPPADPSIAILSVTSTTTLEQPATVVQNSSTASGSPYTVSTGTADRAIAYQHGSSNERAAVAAVIGQTSQEQQEVLDPAQAVTVPAPQPATHQPAGSTTPSGSAISQASASSGTDLKNALPFGVEPADDPLAAPNAGAIAFAARLTPTAESQPPASDSNRPAEPLPGSQPSQQLAAPTFAKQIATGADLPADANSGEGGGQSDQEKMIDRFAKPDSLLPQIQLAATDQNGIPANNHASTSPLSPAAHMDQVINPPAEAPKTNNDITVRIPDSTGQGTAVRFVERAGEVHVSVRTGDVEMAHSLRGGLNDFVSRLEDGGIRTEVWQPGSGSNGASSENDSQQPFADPDGSNGRQYSSGSNSEQESKQQNKPRWVEELEGSIGNPNSKETQLLWQA